MGRLLALTVLVAGLMTALWSGRPARAAQLNCPSPVPEGVLCISARTDVRHPYSPGQLAAVLIDVAHPARTGTTVLVGLQVTIGVACRNNGPIVQTFVVTIPDQTIVKPSSTSTRISQTYRMPSGLCPGPNVYLHQAGPLTGIIVSDSQTSRAVLAGVTGRGANIIPIGGTTAFPGPLSGVPQLSGLGLLIPIGVALGVGGMLAVLMLFRRPSRAPDDVGGRG